ncbi:hypothetical protein [uncultured Bacteroides sp.]|uniref:hypothetical protein n=1 Tax=uncultured Bacteroides sp. TaxID=162156 RepID=UPI002AA91330|nr:hypothetical protein [uncultured Bacteroides sp.]
MKKVEQLYFKDEDSCSVQSLEDFINEAKEEGLSEITLFEADPDTEKEYIWCEAFGETKEKSECRKKCCSGYEKPENGNICADRGTLYWHGRKMLFNVTTSKLIREIEVEEDVAKEMNLYLVDECLFIIANTEEEAIQVCINECGESYDKEGYDADVIDRNKIKDIKIYDTDEDGDVLDGYTSLDFWNMFVEAEKKSIPCVLIGVGL